jgi:3-hydroxyacyl-CoA dehydrogenase
VDAVAAALTKPFDEGMRSSATLSALMQTPENRGPAPCVLRRARRPPRSPTCRKTRRLRPIAKVGVIGAGTMGGGITMNFLNAGIPVCCSR